MCIAALVPLVALTLLPQAPYAAQQRPTDPYRVEWENDQVRVARVTLAPGQSLDTAAPNGRVVIFLTADLDGRLPSHEAAWVEDAAVTNRGASRFEAIVIDMKSAPSGAPGMTPAEAGPTYRRYGLGYAMDRQPRMINLVDNAHVTVTRERYAGNSYIDAFHFHPRDAVVVYLNGGYTWPAVSYWGADRVRRGDVRIVPANALHTLGNASSDPLDFVIVSRR